MKGEKIIFYLIIIIIPRVKKIENKREKMRIESKDYSEK